MRKTTLPHFLFYHPIALQREHIDIYHHRGDGKEHTVETVKDTTMSGEHIARVLNAKVTLDHRLCEVTKGAKHHHYERHAYPLPYVQESAEVSHSHTTSHGEQSATDRALPRLLGRDARE